MSLVLWGCVAIAAAAWQMFNREGRRVRICRRARTRTCLRDVLRKPMTWTWVARASLDEKVVRLRGLEHQHVQQATGRISRSSVRAAARLQLADAPYGWRRPTFAPRTPNRTPRRLRSRSARNLRPLARAVSIGPCTPPMLPTYRPCNGSVHHAADEARDCDYVDADRCAAEAAVDTLAASEELARPRTTPSVGPLCFLWLLPDLLKNLVTWDRVIVVRTLCTADFSVVSGSLPLSVVTYLANGQRDVRWLVRRHTVQ